ncbi:hypothetical protein ABZW32_32125, partial [Streptomyces sp. NPDC004667]
WGMEAVHEDVPRGKKVDLGTVGTTEEILTGPSVYLQRAVRDMFGRVVRDLVGDAHAMPLASGQEGFPHLRCRSAGMRCADLGQGPLVPCHVFLNPGHGLLVVGSVSHTDNLPQPAGASFSLSD